MIRLVSGSFNRTVSGTSIAYSGHSFDLHELMLVSKDSHTQQRAQDVMCTERSADNLPGSDEIISIGRCHEHACTDDVLECGSSCLESGHC